ncbi:MAG TPA: pentapeptide repeat-containing protein, partial [Thermoanaerobaculia bacterium]|nr:pentapeptide repeat-containing protein [Thermoanaerobaculia bacterium]
HATGPDVKVLLSLREDYLPELEALRQSVPTIFQKMMRLDALTLDGARDAIVRPAALEFPNKTAFTYEPEVVDSMLAFLQRRKIGNRWVDTGMVDPGQLQILCQHLDRRRRERGATIITRDDLGGDAGMQRILRRFYRDILRRVPAVRAGWGGQRWQPSRSNFLLFHFPRVAVRTLIQKGLITRTGYRDSLMGETIVDRYGVAHEDLWRMVDAKLIRAVTRLDSQFFELTHDSLIGPIRTAARARRYKAAGVWAAAAVCAWIVTIIPDLVQNYREWREQKKIVALAASVVAPEDKHTMLGSLAGANKLANEDEVRDRRIATLIEQGQRDFRNEPLAGVRLSNLNWLSPNLSGADLKRAQFEAVTLYDADLSGAQLPLATFRETRLWKCSLRQANAVAADFSGSMFADVDMSGLRGRECDFHLTMMYGVNLTGADLTGANFEGVDFSHVDMTNADVTNVRFDGTAWWEASGWSAAQWKSLLADYPPDAVRQSRHYTAMLESYDQAIERTQQAHEKALALNERAWYRAVRGAELPLALQDANDAVTHGMVLANDAVANILDTR